MMLAITKMAPMTVIYEIVNLLKSLWYRSVKVLKKASHVPQKTIQMLAVTVNCWSWSLSSVLKSSLTSSGDCSLKLTAYMLGGNLGFSRISKQKATQMMNNVTPCF